MNNDNIIKMKIRTNDELKLDVNAGSREVDPVFVNSPAYTITYTDINYWNNKSDFSGSYTDLTDKPTIPTKTSDLDNDSGFITNTVNDLTNYTLSSSLSSVATSGSYTDLINKPTIDNNIGDIKRAFGDVFTSNGSYTATMYGNLVGTYIGKGIWKIDYEGGFEYSNPGSNYYEWGISITKINTLLGLTLETLTNTPTISSYISYGTNGGLNTGAKGFATCFEYKSSLNALLPARYYNSNGDIGGWGLSTFANGSAFYATIYLKEQ